MNGQRLVHLVYSDAPRVAQALVDKLRGRAQVRHGVIGTTNFIEFIYPGVYAVVIRGDDWAKIFPFIRYGSGPFRPVIPPGVEPDPVPAPQPNRTMPAPRENPGDGFTSFLEFFTWDEYTQIQRMLPMSNVGRDPHGLSYKSFEVVHEPISLHPAARAAGPTSLSDVYDRLVAILQQLFPKDFPTSEV